MMKMTDIKLTQAMQEAGWDDCIGGIKKTNDHGVILTITKEANEFVLDYLKFGVIVTHITKSETIEPLLHRAEITK